MSSSVMDSYVNDGHVVVVVLVYLLYDGNSHNKQVKIGANPLHATCLYKQGKAIPEHRLCTKSTSGIILSKLSTMQTVLPAVLHYTYLFNALFYFRDKITLRISTTSRNRLHLAESYLQITNEGFWIRCRELQRH